jgi:regulator of protease activity HflC (stomatin/prohibitin superfamily)
MKIFRLIIPLVVLLLIVILSTSSCKRIDAGHVGLVVKLYGSEKGVQDVTEVTWVVWYNPITTEVYQFPTFVQNVVFTKDANEGSPSNEEFRVTTKDGLVVAFDVSMNYRVDPTKVAAIFKKYRKPLKDLDHTIMRNYMRDGYNRISNKYTAEEMYSNKAKYQNEAEDFIKQHLAAEGFIVEQVVFLNELRLPASVVENINAKINASQIAAKKEQEIFQERAEAQKQIEKARGDSASRVLEAESEARAILVRAKAQAEANQLVIKSLSPALIEYEKVKKWNGQNPTVVGNGSAPVMMTIK